MWTPFHGHPLRDHVELPQNCPNGTNPVSCWAKVPPILLPTSQVGILLGSENILR